MIWASAIVAFLPDSAKGRRFHCTCGNVIPIGATAEAEPDVDPASISRRGLIRRIGGEAGIIGVVAIGAVVFYIARLIWTLIAVTARGRASNDESRRANH